MKITFTRFAYADMKCYDLDSLANTPSALILSGSKPGADSYWEKDGYAFVGKAEVILTFSTKDEMHASQLAALNAQLQSVRAESQQKENAILLQISKLQALTCEAQPA